MFRVVVAKNTLVATALALLVACSHAGETWVGHGEGGGLASSGVGGALTYYLDMEAVTAGDRDLRRKKYESVIKECESMGEPTVRLSPSDENKLSLVRTQIWQAPDRSAKQIDHWDATNLASGANASSESILQIWSKICHFTGVKKLSERTINFDSGRVYSINLTNGTGSVQSTPPSAALVREPVTAAAQAAAERRDEAVGFVKMAMSNVAGQSCRIWNYPGGAGEPYEECVWSEGQKWGYPATNEGGLVLSNKLEDGSFEKAVTFVVGRLPDGGKVFDIPKNVSIHDETSGGASQ